MENGARILELAKNAALLYESANTDEKRQLLGFVLSNSTWKNGQLTPIYKKPFDLFVNFKFEAETKSAHPSEGMSAFSNFLPGLDSNQQPSD